MANHSPNKWANRFADHSWLWPLITVVILTGFAVVLTATAYQVYDGSTANSFPRILTSGLLSGAGVAVLGAAITGLVTFTAEIRARAERNRTKRIELFHRMREAHIRIALSQQILRAQYGADEYHTQMRALMEVAKKLEEIREEVKVSGNLYAATYRASITEGIARIIVFLQDGVAEYTDWCRGETKSGCGTRDHRHGPWLTQLVKERESPQSRLHPSHEDWEPRGNMPRQYDDGLEKSKLVMRAYVYGSERRTTS